MFKFLSGILIGTCMILPGVSGTVIAIMLGIYEDVIYLVNSKDKNKIRKLLPLILGILIGIFIFGKILLLFYKNYTYQMMYIFIGLILSGIPILIDEIHSKKEKVNIIYLLISLLISIIVFIIPVQNDNNLSFFNLFIGGFLYIGGKIIPGISSSFFLMILGLYEYFLSLITNPFSIDMTFIPFLLGILLGLYVFIKLINYLLINHFSKTYSSIIGFILGSLVAIFPGFELTKRGILSFILMLISLELVSKISKK